MEHKNFSGNYEPNINNKILSEIDPEYRSYDCCLDYVIKNGSYHLGIFCYSGVN